MKKLFVSILVLTLIVGFSALALGGTGTEASADQTLTVNVSSTFSVTIPDSVTLEVGPNTTDSETKTLDYSYNDTAANSITVDVVSGADFHTMTLTVSAANAGSGTGDSFTISTGTSGATLISGLSATADSYSADVTLEGSKVSWDEPAATNSDALTLVYKMVS